MGRASGRAAAMHGFRQGHKVRTAASRRREPTACNAEHMSHLRHRSNATSAQQQLIRSVGCAACGRGACGPKPSRRLLGRRCAPSFQFCCGGPARAEHSRSQTENGGDVTTRRIRPQNQHGPTPTPPWKDPWTDLQVCDISPSAAKFSGHCEFEKRRSAASECV